MNVCDRSLCTGCGVCVDACPQGCIEMKYDTDGFLQSFVNDSRCINCKKCVAVCPANNPNIQNRIKSAFKIRRTDAESIMESTSGGVASLLSEYVVDGNGVAVGCGFDADLVLRHSVADSREALDKFKGSKYVQSNTSGIYRTVKKTLVEGKRVLFVGTPCQVSALCNYLAEPYDNLLTVDLVCHGVASQKILDKYVKEMQAQRHQRIKDIKFRNKDVGYINCSQNSLKFIGENDVFTMSPDRGIVMWFASGLSIRNSCYGCNFVSTFRCSDITLADYNGADLSEEDKRYGVSMAFANTDKGRDALLEITDKAVLEQKDLDICIRLCRRLNEKSKAPATRKKFFSDMDKFDVEKLVSKYTLKKILPNKLVLYINAIKRRLKI